jgi:hypothetical protein
MGQNQETRIIRNQAQTLAPLGFGPPNPLVAMTYCPDIHAYEIVRRLLDNNSGAVRPAAGDSELRPRLGVDRIRVG